MAGHSVKNTSFNARFRRAALVFAGAAAVGLLLALPAQGGQDPTVQRASTRPSRSSPPQDAPQATSNDARQSQPPAAPARPALRQADAQEAEGALQAQPRPAVKAPPPGHAERIELIKAARQAAVDELRRAIESQPLGSELTVAELLDRLPAAQRREFRTLLASSSQVGGARYPTSGTAEVQLQASGDELLSKLLDLTAAGQDRAPITPAQLEQSLGGWRGRTFTATGGSASAQVSAELRVRPESMPPSWAGVSEEARREAVLRARDNAVKQYLEVARGVQVLDDNAHPVNPSTEQQADLPPPEPRPVTLADVFGLGSVEAESRDWLAQRPVSRLRYGENRQVEIKLAVDPADWVGQLRQSIERPDGGLLQVEEAHWQKLIERLSDALSRGGPAEIVGRATAAQADAPASGLQLPAKAPQWAQEALVARANAAAVEEPNVNKRRLLTKQAAFRLAAGELRQNVEGLVIGPQQTVSDYLKADPSLSAWLDTALGSARQINAVYHADDSVTVEVSFSGRALWQALETRFRTPRSEQ